MSNNARTLTLRQSEVWFDITRASSGKGAYAGFRPTTVTLPAVKNIAKGYLRYRIVRITLEYEPAVGTTVGGVVHWGIVPGDVSAAPSEAQAKAAFPRASGPAWMRQRITFTHNQVMTKPWAERDETAFTVITYFSGSETVAGFIEARYHVVFDLPTAV